MAIAINSHPLIGINMKLRARPFLIVVALLCLLLLAIWGNLSASVEVKYVVSGCAIAILAAFVTIVYRYAMKEPPVADDILQPITERIPVTPPPQPTHPTIAEPLLYDYRPKPIPAIGYTVVTGLVLAALLIGAIYAHASAEWYIFTGCCLPVGVAWCYWQWIVWRGVRLIITKSTKQLQRVLPTPFQSSTPTMPNKAGAAQDVTQKMSDRLLGTCRLFSNVRASGDEMFHNLKWLPHPDELRRALGMPVLRKNSWWIFSKKNP